MSRVLAAVCFLSLICLIQSANLNGIVEPHETNASSPDFKPECVLDSDCRDGTICTYDMECLPLAAVNRSCKSDEQCSRKTPLTICNEYHFCSCLPGMNFNDTECVDAVGASAYSYRQTGRSPVLPAVLGTAGLLVLIALGLGIFLSARRYKRNKAAKKSEEKEKPSVLTEVSSDEAGPLPPKPVLV